MREHYSLDRLVDYSTADISGSTQVVNPQYREVDDGVRKQTTLLARKRCECDGIVLCEDIDSDKVTQYEAKKSALRKAVEEMTHTVADLKSCRKAPPPGMYSLPTCPRRTGFGCWARRASISSTQ